MPMAQLAPHVVAVAFHESNDGAKAARDASAAALAALTELHLALASREMLAFFEKRPGIDSIRAAIDRAEDDEGHHHMETHIRVTFSDGTRMPDYDCDYDHDAISRELGGSRSDLFEAAEELLDEVALLLPLARPILERSVHTRESARAMASPSFAARQEAFAIGREVPEADQGAPTRRI